MHIKKIIIKNFKSFNKRVEIPFFKGFTVISGPNGSGKSNIVDAILFCLGLTPSTRVLRADRLTDLIHSGNGSLNEAEVTVVFDNSEGLLGKDRETRITRRIRRTEKGYYSYYYINKKSTKISDIHRLLANAGIHADAYNIVMQGDVTRIAEMSPFQRRKIIDDIAGISEFDEKKERALEELEVVREKIERINTILIEVNNQLQQLASDREEALKYKSLLEEKDKYLRYLNINKYKNLLTKKKRIETEISSLEIEKDKISGKIIELTSIIEELNSNADEISSKIYELADENYRSIQEEIIELSSQIEGIKKSSELMKKEVKEIDNEKTQLLVTISKLKDELEAVEEEIQKFSIQKISIQEELDKLNAKRSIINIKLGEIGESHSKLKDKLIEKREKLEEEREKRSAKVNERDKNLEIIRRIGIEIEELNAEKDKLESEIQSNLQEIVKLKKEREKIEKKLEEKVIRKQSTDNRIFEIRRELSEIEEEIKSIEVELSKIQAQLTVIESHFSKAVELVLEAKKRRALPGVFGTVSQLCEVSNEFALALETAAGNSLQYIVVENEDDAVRCIKYLKQIDGGRATFIPLNRIKKNFKDINLDKSVLKKEGVIDYAVNLISCDRKFKPIFNFIFRDTLVVENIDVAKMLMGNRRIVTLDGDLIERSGTLTGGSPEKRRGILATKELLEKQNKLNEEITVLKSRKAGITSTLRSVEEEKRTIQAEIDEINKIYSKISNEISLKESTVGSLSERIEEVERKIEEKEEERRKIYSNIKNLEREIIEVEENLKSIGKDINELEKRLKGSEIPKLTEELEMIKEEISRNREAMVVVNKNLENYEYRKRQLSDSIFEKEMKVSQIEDKKIEILQKMKDDENLAIKIENRLRELKEKEKEVGEEVKSLRDERNKILEEIRSKETERDSLRFKITEIDEKIKGRMDALQMTEEQIKEVGEIDYSEEERIPPNDEVKKRLEEIEKELMNFGDVNLKAIQDYEEVKSRRDELVDKKLILEKEREEILERIEKYEGMKRSAFFESFNAINSYFKEIISNLTDGEGELKLDNFDDPFNSGLHMNVKIRDKPVQKIESMSGGEKSLVALSLIFAIQKYKPAPFYAFDEIDMFLDGVNVEKVAEMIRERSKDAQFIVVSLRKPTLEKADSIIGVTLSRDNSSTVTGIKMRA